jgi:hypothetical protein
MADLRKRLALLYCGAASLSTGMADHGGFVVVVEIPVDSQNVAI